MTATSVACAAESSRDMVSPLTPERPVAPLSVGLFGCPLDTGNAGVSALGLSTMLGLSNAAPGMQFTMYDYGRGARERSIDLGSDVANVSLRGCYNSRRYWRTSNLTNMLTAARLGLGRLHPETRALLRLDGILDISGGDSFADIYGARRFNDVTLPKELAIRLGVPLILLPQTFGPYRSPQARERAAAVVRNARQVWARDSQSYGVLRELLGDVFDPARHRSGVDVAFALPARKPEGDATSEQVDALAERCDVLIGLNVSGLLFNRPGDDVGRFKFRTSYRPLIERLALELLEIPGAALVLTPHVAPSRAMVDDDVAACEDLYRSLPTSARDRVVVLPRDWNVMQLKWAIGRCAWFCGTRMHACIGALSQGVPTTAIAYSDKTLGVFQTAGVGDSVVDPRQQDEDGLVAGILRGYRERERLRATLQSALVDIQARLKEQFSAIAGAVTL